MKRKVVILGDGVAGQTAAIYAARAELQPLIITGYQSGGQLTETTEVENFPGFPEGIDGTELVERMRKQATKFGAEYKFDRATKIEGEEMNYKISLEGGEIIEAETIIIATGASAKKLGLKAEETYFGRGISACATCDAAFTKDKTVIVVGGGDVAMEEATFLTRFAKKVYLVHRRDKFRASKIMQKRVFENEKITILWNKIITDVQGDGTKVTKAILKDTLTGEEQELQTDFVFYAIGHKPNTEFLKDFIELDEHGYIKTNRMLETNKPGIWAAGDVQDKIWRQAVTAAGTGAAAAINAERYLSEKEE